MSVSEMLERLKQLAAKDIYTWSEDENTEYLILARETGISIGLDNQLYQR